MNIYHYCGNSAFNSIVSHKEIWASELSLSNDVLEGKWIREIFLQYCNEKKVLASDQNELLSFLDILIACSRAAGFCMSEDGDLLSQWRAYADNGGGVSIGFSSDYFEALGITKRDRSDNFNASLTKIEYDVSKQKTLIAEHLDEILKLVAQGALRQETLLSQLSDDDRKARNEKRNSMLLRFIFFVFYLYTFKNPAFAEEREWRIISHLFRKPNNSSNDLTFGQIHQMDFRSLSDRIIPFTRIKLESLEQPAIIEVMMGPRNLTPDYIVAALLLKCGWANVNIRRSKASFR